MISILSSAQLSQFDQCVLNISLINLCNQESYVGQELQRLHNPWQNPDRPARDPWLDPHQFTLYIPHPDQQYEGITLGAGLTQGYNLEVKRVVDRSRIPYNIPIGGQFVVVMKQKGLDAGFEVAATGLFIRPLALFSLDWISDRTLLEYQALVVKHPVMRDYPSDWQDKLCLFLNHEISYQSLPNLVGYVDQALNRDYRPPSWHEVYLAAQNFAGV
jgi:hypothetical protein